MKKVVVAAMCLTTIAAIFVLLKHPVKYRISIPAKNNFSTNFVYDNKLFITGVAYAQTHTDKSLPAIESLIVPHHLLASGLIAQGIAQLSIKNQPKTIVILSPNHKDTGACSIITTLTDWDTPYGISEVDEKNTKQLLGENICLDDENISIEHGIATLLPYIKYYLPKTKIVPLAFKKNVPLSSLDQLSQKLAALENTVVLASIDFSHGLPSTESESRDGQTQSLITQQDISQIAGLSSEHLDSPPSLITLMGLNKKQRTEQSLLVHSDAATINQKENKDNTSYFLMGFSKSPNPDTKDSWSLISTGDVMLGRSVNTRIIKYKDPTWPFKNVASFLKSADLTLINLESPLTKDCKPADAGMVFCGKSDNVQGLVYSGIDIANIANNHIYNQGLKGVEETVSILSSHNIAAIGLGKTIVKKVGGIQVAFAGFDATSAKPINDEVAKTISDLKKKYPLVIVSFHWGSEYQSKPNEKQIRLAHLAIDSGSDIVIGTHPHWVQTEETYKGKAIFYSLGNFVFDQMWSEQTKKGMVIRLNFSGPNLVSTERFPVSIYDYGQPKFSD